MKIAVYGQYYKTEDQSYVEELFQTLQKHNIEFAIEKNYYQELKEYINVPKAITFSSHKELNKS